MSTGSSSELLAVTCIVTVSKSSSRERTRMSWPPRNTPARERRQVRKTEAGCAAGLRGACHSRQRQLWGETGAAGGAGHVAAPLCAAASSVTSAEVSLHVTLLPTQMNYWTCMVLSDITKALTRPDRIKAQRARDSPTVARLQCRCLQAQGTALPGCGLGAASCEQGTEAEPLPNSVYKHSEKRISLRSLFQV